MVEFGTSFGISTIHLAAAVRDNGAGRVISTELNAAKAAQARANLAEAGLSDRVTILEGDARETLAAVPGPVGFVLLDGWKGLYLPVLRLLEPRLAPGALVLADDTISMAARDDRLPVLRPRPRPRLPLHRRSPNPTAWKSPAAPSRYGQRRAARSTVSANVACGAHNGRTADGGRHDDVPGALIE